MVYLGLCDESLSRGSVDHFTDSQLGGAAHWLHAYSAAPVCQMCGSRMLLVSQVYAPLPASDLHRVLYVFACAQVQCQNKSEAWKVLRSVKKCDTVEKTCTRKTAEAFEDDWGVAGDNWGTSDVVLGSLTSSKTQICEPQICEPLEDLKLSDSATSGFIDPPQDRTFSPFYMYVIAEPQPQTTRKYDNFEEDPAGSSGGGEKYEKTELLHKDKDFHKFYKKIKLAPEQCIRYDLGGLPLLEPPNIRVPPCPHCHSARQFELQIMPALISILKLSFVRNTSVSTVRNTSASTVRNTSASTVRNTSASAVRNTSASCPLDFRTVLVYTCREDCVARLCDEVAVCVPEPDVVIPSRDKVVEGEGARPPVIGS